MRRSAWSTFTLALVAAGALCAGAVGIAQTGRDTFQQGLVKERAEGKPLEAIQLYLAAVKQAGSDRALAARALVQLAGCYRMLGNTGEARRVYERVVAEFRDQPGAVTDARAGLAAMLPRAAAAPRPIPRVPHASRRIDVPYGAVPSPDERYLAFLSDGHLSVRHVATGVVRRLTTPTTGQYPCDFAWSRDSRRLAYQWCREREGDLADLSEVRVIGVDGSADRVVHAATEDDVVPRDWSPDGRSIAVLVHKSSDDSLRLGVLSVTNGSILELKNFGPSGPWMIDNVKFSPDGRLVVYGRPKTPGVRDMRDIVALPVEGGDERVLVRQTTDSRFVGWTPRGGLLFASSRSGTVDIWLVQLEGDQVDDLPVRVKPDIGPVEPIALTDAGAFHYAGLEGLALISDVYVVTLDARTGTVTSTPRMVSQSNGHGFMPRWSRDGRQLAFKSGPHGVAWPAVSILTLGTGDERVIRPRPHVYMGPAFDWSPDGRDFIMQANPTTSLRAADGWGFYRVDALTGETSLIAPNVAPGGQPQVLRPDGRLLGYRQGGNRIVLRRLDSGEEKTILDPGAFIRSFAFSPDGTSIAYLAARGENDPQGDVHVASIADGRTQVLAEYHAPVVANCCADVTWSHDGRYVIFADLTADTLVAGTTKRQMELWRVPAAGGPAEKMGLTADSMLTASVSPDGRRLAYSAEPDRGGHWVLEGFLPPEELRPAQAAEGRK